MDLQTLLADVRIDLQDTGETPRWSDEILTLFIRDGISDYSTWLPRRRDRVKIDAVDGVFTLPPDFIEDIYVEAPLDTYLERRDERPGSRFITKVKPTQYFIEGGVLHLNGPHPSIWLTYFAVHEVETIPERDVELIRLFAKARAYEQMRSKQATLDRFKMSGKRDDNPLHPETYNLMNEYYAKVASRVSGSVIRLYRTGRVR